ncbi:MAG TPA: D-alanyl-D-alanine carboxypeptidase/D-alanyl-D-alanine-endopeptidase [Gemmatimonadaceae bacterium]|nr:D-alanyl-D-alanine carboxypeptidase/D-alanyl-D-alanine-endopeptidase [Gemmatimonadaceae bacterium]
MRAAPRPACARRLFATAAAALALIVATGPQLRAQAGATLAERIQRVVDRPEFRHAMFGIEFYSLDSNRPIYTLNADKLFVPGSTTKLLTEGTALELMGADYQFHTRVYRTGSVDKSGTLAGDLVLVASGDPNLSARVRSDGTLAFENEDHAYDGDVHTRAVPGDPLLIIRKLAAQVAEHGIKRISGRVLVDATLFPGGDRELGTDVVMSPIVVNDNLVDLAIGPGARVGTAATIAPAPATSYLRIVNKITTSAAGSAQNIDLVSDTADAAGLHTVTLGGTTPAGGPPILHGYRVPDPARFAEVTFAEALKDRGVVTDQKSVSRVDFAAMRASYVPANVVAEHVSLPLREEVRITLKVSQNLHASMTPRIVKAVLAPGDSSKTGFDLEREFLQRAGLDVMGAQQADGAGGDAHFTPEFMVSYLAYMSHQKDSATFRNALPILGRDGTLWNIQPASPAAGHVFAKTGTFGVSDPLNRRTFVTGKGLAGYITTKDGRHLAFTVYVNNVSVSTDPAAITAVVGQALGEIAAAAYEVR